MKETTRMSNRVVILVASLLLTLSTIHSSAHAQGLFGKSPATAQLLAHGISIQGGKSFTVGVLLTPEKGWHTYWENPGDSGLPTKIKWELPQGFTAGAIQWPTPHAFEMGGIAGLGYNGPALLLVQINPPAKLQNENVTIKANVTWLVCKEACIPGRAKLTLVVPVKNEAPSINTQNKKLFDEALAHLPKRIVLTREHINLENKKLSLKLPGMKLPHAVFYSSDESLLELGAKQITSHHSNSNTTTIQANLSMYAPKTIHHIKGIVVANPHDKNSDAYLINIKL